MEITFKATRYDWKTQKEVPVIIKASTHDGEGHPYGDQLCIDSWEYDLSAETGK